ncbi:MAG: hypothetical protein HOE90_04055 [Bacteriovoracaceae bacterium]|jgi:hypothetical protein|nr:hypothetical protein [Bacteriovoracaceae bacterium]
MKLRYILPIFLLWAGQSLAVSLKDYSPYEYKVLFTNPECAEYEYPHPVTANNGDLLYKKPKNTYCTYNDSYESGKRASSPQYQLVKWIDDPKTTEIFMAYLSFSSSAVQKALCRAIENRNIKMTVVLDRGGENRKRSDAAAAGKKSKSQLLLACASGVSHKPKILLKGFEGGIGYAHNKLFVVNPRDPKVMKLAFSSGNMSSGVVLHHENWHFITTSKKSFFAQSHVCLMDSVKTAKTKWEYKEMIADCKADIKTPAEDDIEVFFVPGEGEAAIKRIQEAVYWSKTVDFAAHRLFLGELIDALKKGMSYGLKVRGVVDDDIYWAGLGEVVGPNMTSEYYRVKGLVDKGADVKYMETNHSLHLLHHNKFLIFDNARKSSKKPALYNKPAVFAGAGNFTSSAFKMSASKTNYENYYYITIPEVVSAFQKQYERLHRQLATSYDRLPTENVEAH